MVTTTDLKSFECSIHACNTAVKNALIHQWSSLCTHACQRRALFIRWLQVRTEDCSQ